MSLTLDKVTLTIDERGIVVQAPEGVLVGIRCRKTGGFFVRMETNEKTLIYSDVYDTYGCLPLREFKTVDGNLVCESKYVDDTEFVEAYQKAAENSSLYWDRLTDPQPWKMAIPSRMIYSLDRELGL